MVVGVVRPVVVVGTAITVVLVDVHDGPFAFCVVVCGGEGREGENEDVLDDLPRLLAVTHDEAASTNREMHSAIRCL